MHALGHDHEADLTTPLCEAMYARSDALQKLIVASFDGQALAAVSMTKMAHDIETVKDHLLCTSGFRVRRATA